MQHNDEGESIPTLEEIRQLFVSGKADDALAQVESYLDSYPDDLEGMFLKVEIGLTYERCAVFIANALPRLERAFGMPERVIALYETISAAIEYHITQAH